MVSWILTRPLAACFAAEALRRAPGPRPIHAARAQAQHAAYVAALRAAAPSATHLEAPADDRLPDSVFVEDLAVALPGGVLLTWPGAPSRRPERAGVAQALAQAGMPLLGALGGEATLDGGDVLRLPDRVLCGLSARTSAAGLAALRAAAAPLPVLGVPVPGGELHLKSLLSWGGPGVGLLVAAPHERWAREVLLPAAGALAPLGGLTWAADPLAANVVRVGDTVLWQGEDEPALAALRARGGVRWVRVDLSELALADGALTCCSVLVA